MEAWQLLQGKMPSVIGGGVTGNSWSAPLTGEIKQTPPKKTKAIAQAIFSIFISRMVRKTEVYFS
jgi:hypothetical protein